MSRALHTHVNDVGTHGVGLAERRTRTEIHDEIVYPAIGAAITLATLTGPGVVTNIQWTHSLKDMAKFGRLQVFVDGEEVPSLDAEIGTLMCMQEDAWIASGALVSTRHMLSSLSGSTWPGTSTGVLSFPIPYTNGCVVKFFNPSVTPGSSVMFSTVHYQPGAAPGWTDRWRLRSAGTPFRLAVGGGPEDHIALIDIPNAAGVVVWVAFAVDGVSNYSYLERPVDFYFDDEVSPSYQGNAEDWWGSGYYFGSMSRYSSPIAMVSAANNASYTFYGGVDLLEMQGGLRFEQRCVVKHGTTYSIKVVQRVSTVQSTAAVALYYADIDEPFAPSAPVTPVATGGDTSASVTWSPPLSSGSSKITSYTVTASPDGVVVSAAASATTAAFTGLTNGVAYTFSVTASSAEGTSAAAVSNTVTPGSPAVSITDNFTGSDGTAINGRTTTTGGKTWVATGYTIQSNKAQDLTATGTNHYSILDAGVSDCTVQLDMVYASQYPALTFRYVDANNTWTFYHDISATSMKVGKTVAGVFTPIATYVVASGTHTIKVVMSGNNLSFYDGATLLGTFADSFNATATKHGFSNYNSSTSTVDNWQLTA